MGRLSSLPMLPSAGFPELLRNDPGHAWLRRLVHEVASNHR
ncbi:MAG: hypothetical protein Q8N23_05920 [Archangium sp.]|nr:hypothetical protein [Archangium sp.]